MVKKNGHQAKGVLNRRSVEFDERLLTNWRPSSKRNVVALNTLKIIRKTAHNRRLLKISCRCHPKNF